MDHDFNVRGARDMYIQITLQPDDTPCIVLFAMLNANIIGDQGNVRDDRMTYDIQMPWDRWCLVIRTPQGELVFNVGFVYPARGWPDPMQLSRTNVYTVKLNARN
jgi:hypothetical protein